MSEAEVKELVPYWLINSSVYSVIITDLEGRYVFVNNTVKERFNFITDNLIGKPVNIAMFPSDIEKCNEAVKACFADPEKPVSVQIRKQINAGGEFIWTEWEFSILKDDLNIPSGVICIGHDLTETERSHKQAKLFADKIEMILSEFSDGFFVLDSNFRFITLNKVSETALSVSKENITGKVYTDVIAKKNCCYNIFKYFQISLHEQKSLNFEEYDKKNEKWYRINTYPSSEGLTVIFKDITERKKVQQNLLLSEKKLTAVLNSTRDSIIFINKDYEVLAFNNSAIKVSKALLGIMLEENKSVLKGIDPLFRNDFISFTERAFKGNYVEFEKEIVIGKVKSWYLIRYFPVYNKEGEIIGCTFNTINIERRKRAEGKLKENEVMLKAIYNSTSDGCIFIDKSMHIAFLNKVASQKAPLLFDGQLLVGDPLLEKVKPEFKKDIKNYIAKVLKGKEIVTETLISNIWAEIKLFPVYNTTKNIVGVSFNFSDITDRKNKELMIISQNKTLREIAWEQNHSFRRPIANIQGLVKLLIKSETEELFDQCLKYLEQESISLDQIIEKITNETNKSQEFI